MSSKIIAIVIAIVAAVLSLAAPVAVDAQTPTPTLTEGRNTFGHWSINYSGFPSGQTYTVGYCGHATAHPASCTFDSMGLASGGQCGGLYGGSPTGSGTLYAVYGVPSFDLGLPYTRFAIYSDANCATEVASVTFTHPASVRPTWGVRDITHDSATIYVEGAFLTHGVVDWGYRLTPGGGACTNVDTPEEYGYQATESPTSRLTGLSAGSTYTYDIYLWGCQPGTLFSSVTFTTPGGSGPPPPAPPTGVEATAVEATTDGSGSVTLSWANPGDPDIATYEYYLQRAGGPAGEWRTVPGSNADTTSVTIDLATGEARAVNNVNNAAPPMVEWTIYLRARGRNGNAGQSASTVVSAAVGTNVPALPAGWALGLAFLLFRAAARFRPRS